MESNGTVENLQRMADSKQGFDLALVQGGVGEPKTADELRYLGSLYYEPLWVFYRRGTNVNTLRGLRVASPVATITSN